MTQAQRRALDDFYARIIDMVWDLASIREPHNVICSTDFCANEYNFRVCCCGQTHDYENCLRLRAYIKCDKDARWISPYSIPSAAWILMDALCNHCLDDQCPITIAYNRQVSPWTIAGRLAPRIDTWSTSGVLAMGGFEQSAGCFVCGKMESLDGNVLPDDAYCCDRQNCIYSLWDFVCAAFASWCLRELFYEDIRLRIMNTHARRLLYERQK